MAEQKRWRAKEGKTFWRIAYSNTGILSVYKDREAFDVPCSTP